MRPGMRPGPTGGNYEDWCTIEVVCDCREDRWIVATFAVDVGSRQVASDGTALHYPTFVELPAESAHYRRSEEELAEWVRRGMPSGDQPRRPSETRLTGFLVDAESQPIEPRDRYIGDRNEGVDHETFPLKCPRCRDNARRRRDKLAPILAELVCIGIPQVTLRGLQEAYRQFDATRATPCLDARYAGWKRDTQATPDVPDI